MKWYHKLYLSDSASKHARRTIYKLKHGKLAPGYYLITLSDHPDHLLEIIGTAYLVQRPLWELCPMVVGIARYKEEALELTQRILLETYEHRGDFQVKEYLQDR
ncbi:hypothetical protein [Blautia hydrogenotrophica]|uniref:hypothetical protein n=1 Tax=Blautia hydrogenotrophica TaxID=53443 RepID=UPI0023F3FC44|nr:hypothetical protein [Blautia hydrogenotrophica]